MKARTFYALACGVLLVLALAWMPFQGERVQAQPDLATLTIPYPGRLSSQAGAPVVDGPYDLAFGLFASTDKGQALWSETQRGVNVQGGSFAVVLGSVSPLPASALAGGERWLEIAVRGPGQSSFVTLAPRQRLAASASSALQRANSGACPHDHIAEVWTGNGPLTVRNSSATGAGLVGVHMTTGNYAESGTDRYGLHAVAFTGVGIYGQSPRDDAVRGDSDAANRSGMYGYHSATGMGVTGRSVRGSGVYAESGGSGHENAALRALSTNVGQGVAGYFVNNGAWPTLECDQNGNGRVLDLQNHGDNDGNGGGDFLAGFSRDAELQFRITSSGQGRSDVGWATPAEDFAEMLPAEDGLEPGDVLAIAADGRLTRSTQPYQTSVAGVYSTRPGFLGGQPVEGTPQGSIPLAMVGVVPVKVCAENGAVRPGDLLVSSSAPGHAMRAGANPPQGSVLGKALGRLEDGSGVIQMLATLQ